MHSMRIVFLGICTLVSFPLATVGTAAAPNADEVLLREAKIPTDGPGLLEFFHQRTDTVPTEAALKALIAGLGDDSFQKREQASHQLVVIGGRAKSFLQRAVDDVDCEIAFRAKACLRQIEQGGTGQTVSAAARLLATRKPAHALEVLLDYLPSAEDESVAEEVRLAIGVVGIRDDKADPALVAGLSDKDPVKRAACAMTLGRAKIAEHLPAVRKLLQDPDPIARLRVGLVLVEGRDKEAVPVLIDLLAQLPTQETGLIEDFLYRLAEDKAPTLASGPDEASRKKYRDAWAAWWQENRLSIDLAKLENATQTLGFTLIVLLDNGKIVDLDAANRVRWSIDNLRKPLDAQMLPGERVLVAEHDADRVTVRNRKNEILWEKKVEGPLMAQRLPNGNTVVANRVQVVEFDRTGKTVFTYAPKDGSGIMKALKLPNGELAVVAEQGNVVSRYLRVDATGKEGRGFPVEVRTFGGKIDVLANGHVLVAEMNNNRVVEHDASGKIVWEGATEGAIAAVRLANGHTLVTTMNQHRAVELDRAGKEVWEYKSDTRVTRAFRH